MLLYCEIAYLVKGNHTPIEKWKGGEKEKKKPWRINQPYVVWMQEK